MIDQPDLGQSILLITTIQLIDEYFDLKQRVTVQKKKIDDLSNKFQEIKKLAIKYKDGKYVNIIHKNDERYNIITPIISKKIKIMQKIQFIESEFYFDSGFNPSTEWIESLLWAWSYRPR